MRKRGLIELDIKGQIFGISSDIWRALNIDPNLIIGTYINDYVVPLSLEWDKITKGTIVANKYPIQLNQQHFSSSFLLEPVFNNEGIVSRVKCFLYNVKKMKNESIKTVI